MSDGGWRSLERGTVAGAILGAVAIAGIEYIFWAKVPVPIFYAGPYSELYVVCLAVIAALVVGSAIGEWGFGPLSLPMLLQTTAVTVLGGGFALKILEYVAVILWMFPSIETWGEIGAGVFGSVFVFIPYAFVLALWTGVSSGIVWGATWSAKRVRFW